MFQRADKKQIEQGGRSVAGNSRSVANGSSGAGFSSKPVQRFLGRHPQGAKQRFDTQRVLPGTNIVANDYLLENSNITWFRYKRHLSLNEIYVTSEDNANLYIYHLNTGGYRNVDIEAHAGVVAEMQQVNAGGNANSGVHYPFNYQANFPHLWQAGYANGHANAHYFNRLNNSDWQLLPGRSASLAIQDWLTGLTIAECASTLVAIQLNQIRLVFGDIAFDTYFGSANAAAMFQPLRICANIGQCVPANFIAGVGTTLQGGPALKVGAKYFFSNISYYTRKHPEGFFQGENCVYIGNDRWSGFGVGSHTTTQMYELMRDQYNLARTEEDYETILSNPDNHHIPEDTINNELAQGSTFSVIYGAHLNEMNPYVLTNTDFLPDQITVQDLLADQGAGITSQGIKLNVRGILGI